MNGKNRHTKYRKSVYRRRNIKSFLIVLILVLIFSLTAFIVIGNLLKLQSDKRHESDTSDTDTTLDNDLSNDRSPVKNTLAYPVFLETKESGNFAGRLDALNKKGIYDASVPLNTVEGELLFKSSISNKIGYLQGEANVTLERATSSAKARNIYLSGIFYINAFEQEDPLIRSVELSRDAAIIAEALNAGFNDVILIAPHMTDAHVEEAVRFIDDIKALSDNGHVGLCISDHILSIENSQSTSQIIDKLNSSADFLSIDLSKTDVSADTSTVNDAISPNQHYILMYKIRVLLPKGDTDDVTSSIISEAERNGIKNILIMP